MLDIPLTITKEKKDKDDQNNGHTVQGAGTIVKTIVVSIFLSIIPIQPQYPIVVSMFSSIIPK